MMHAAARGDSYDCFVRPDTRIPFMAMPDAIDALLRLAAAPRDRLTRTAYNLTAFSPTAQEIHDVARAAFPRAALGWRVDDKRQEIVDSWPEDVDDSTARRDWGFSPTYDFRRAFDEYLIPTIRQRYQS
jgi:nucleoside-diphosphate-sugar epimerase